MTLWEETELCDEEYYEWRMCYDEEWYDEDAWSCWWLLYINMYLPLRRVVLSLPTEDETPEEYGQTVMFGHAAPGTPHLPTQGNKSDWKSINNSLRAQDRPSWKQRLYLYACATFKCSDFKK